MYSKTGIIYVYPLDRFTISITNQEKEVMEERAKELNIKLDIKPKKVIITDGKIAVMDWFLNHDTCPFLEGTDVCKIYNDRPLICQAFPRTKYTKEEEAQLMLMKGDVIMPFEDAIETVKEALVKHNS